MPNRGGLTDREAAIDALYRFCWALDEGDPELSASSLTKDATMVLEFTHNGQTPRELVGRDTVVELLMNVVGKPLDTTHMVTNTRCEVDNDTAELQAQILAQHFRRGEGADSKFNDHYLFGNMYKCHVVREGDLWKLSKVIIRPVWTQGNPDIIQD